MAITRRQISKVIIISLLAVLITTFLFLMIFRVQLFTGPNFYIRFDHVGSLVPGGVVRTAGVRIGTVSNIAINREDHRTVLVTVTLYPDQKVRRGSRFLIMSGSLIGDQYVEVIPVPEGEFIADGDIFKGEPIKNLDSFLLSSDTLIKDFTTTMSTLSDILTKNKENINATLENIKDTSAGLKKYLADGEGAEISLLQKTTSLVENLEKSAQALTKLLEGLSSQDSVLTLLNQKETAANMKTTLGNLKKISDDLVKVTDGLKTIMAGLVEPSPASSAKPDERNK